MNSQPICRATAYAYFRFSTPEQSTGDSKRRQSALVNDFAQKHNLILDQSLKMSDLGVSGFSGAHLAKGLGVFLEAIRAGRVAAGSFLLIETFDRLSRRKPIEALGVFMAILTAKVKIATLASPPMIYDENSPTSEVMFALVRMEQAHSESLLKQQRLQSSWRGKRDRIADENLTPSGPAWLVAKPEKKKGFDFIPERKAVVERIFKLASEGAGNGVICKLLNQEKVPTFYKSEKTRTDGQKPKLWQTSYIQKLLTNRAVIGQFQPSKHVWNEVRARKDRIPEGELQENYYPPVISKQQFYAVRAMRSAKAKKGGGRKGASFANIFTKIAKCGYCGYTMEHVDKGGRNRFTHLVCSNAKRGGGCPYVSWRYIDVESAVLKHCSRINLSDAVFPPDTIDRRQQATERVLSLSSQLAEKNQQRENLVAALESLSKDAQTPVLSRMEKCTAEISVLENERREAQLHLDSQSDPEQIAHDVNDALQQFFRLNESASSEERYLLRMRVNAEIQRIILGIVLFRKHLPFEKASQNSTGTESSIMVFFASGDWNLITPDGTAFEVITEQTPGSKPQFKGVLANPQITSKTELARKIEGIYHLNQLALSARKKLSPPAAIAGAPLAEKSLPNNSPSKRSPKEDDGA